MCIYMIGLQLVSTNLWKCEVDQNLYNEFVQNIMFETEAMAWTEQFFHLWCNVVNVLFLKILCSVISKKKKTKKKHEVELLWSLCFLVSYPLNKWTFGNTLSTRKAKKRIHTRICGSTCQVCRCVLGVHTKCKSFFPETRSYSSKTWFYTV